MTRSGQAYGRGTKRLGAERQLLLTEKAIKKQAFVTQPSRTIRGKKRAFTISSREPLQVMLKRRLTRPALSFLAQSLQRAMRPHNQTPDVSPLRPSLALLAVCGLALSLGAGASVRAQDGDITGALGPRTAEAVQTRQTVALPPVATGVRLIGDDDKIRMEIDLTRPVEMRAFTMSEPYRVIIDSEEVNFQLKPGVGAAGRGLISAFRYGLFAPGKSRIVIDLARPAVIDNAALIDAKEGEATRIVLDLTGTDAAGFAKARAASPITNIARRGDRETPLPRRSQLHEKTSALPIVVLDAGHGGPDSGAIASNGAQEKDIVLAFVKALRDKLEATGQVKVLLSRPDDRFITLAGRVNFARDNKAALFVSIHADSVRGAGDDARGFAVYTVSDRASDAEAAKLADRENKADAIAGVDMSDEPADVADILIDLTQRETRAFSTFFARTVVQEMKGSTALHSTPLRAAGFRVLRAHDVPSVLVELGFLSSGQDLKLLTSPEWRDKATENFAKAIDLFFKKRAVAGASARP